ncbi:hypothetical protein DV711_17085 [Motiliproteus coralliicola]|uniref:Uncharacterized protein n=1 Tax=Motiliproteus coralliicola TaxID=2283196 RepID=A0A369W8Q9_9GAMM|nr:hypothetical protein [Motiliproteus coralliicola]RDE18370.1 hypothetical protein DV711_17085 [Motiliproteus coralliicola]
MVLDILESTLLAVGFAVFASSIILYLKRTTDYRAVLMFWQAEMALSHREFIVNRIGIILMFMGIVLRFANSWMVA